jgi:serine protease SohB
LEFISEYGLFLAKTLTFLIAFVVCVAVIASAADKNKGKSSETVEIEHINERFKEYEDQLREAILAPEEIKSLEKQKKKDEKAEKKKKKKQSKKDENAEEESKPRVFVADFDGDIKASDTTNLRKIISVILTQANEKDEVVVRLESGGGMVHSYGLAASQLARITNKNIKLTVCVDRVAASGGYMMACVANHIVAAPFAIIGSIGVIAQIPNFHRLLKKADVDYEMYTAGEYKRTLTMFGENTDKGREKFVEELEDTHLLFKDYVKEHREVVDVSEVATGEVWFGKRALEKQLVDELKTSDEYLFELSERADIYELKIEQKQKLMERLGVSVSAGVESAAMKLINVLKTRYF